MCLPGKNVLPLTEAIEKCASALPLAVDSAVPRFGHTASVVQTNLRRASDVRRGVQLAGGSSRMSLGGRRRSSLASFLYGDSTQEALPRDPKPREVITIDSSAVVFVSNDE